MLYWLLYEKLFPFFHPFRIFRYLTFRTAFASLTALLIAMFIGPYVIQKLREFQIGQFVRDERKAIAILCGAGCAVGCPSRGRSRSRVPGALQGYCV